MFRKIINKTIGEAIEIRSLSNKLTSFIGSVDKIDWMKVAYVGASMGLTKRDYDRLRNKQELNYLLITREQYDLYKRYEGFYFEKNNSLDNMEIENER